MKERENHVIYTQNKRKKKKTKPKQNKRKWKKQAKQNKTKQNKKTKQKKQKKKTSPGLVLFAPSHNFFLISMGDSQIEIVLYTAICFDSLSCFSASATCV